MDSQGEQWCIQSEDLPPNETPAKADVPGCAVRLEPYVQRDFEAAAAVVEAMVAERSQGSGRGDAR